VQGHAATYYWNMPVDDNSFYLLRTASNQTAFLHASWTEWKNMFSFEIYGKLAKLEISGFGGSYGTERLAYYRLTPEMGPPETTIFEYPMADDSWNCEWRAFAEDVRLRRQPNPGIHDAQAALRIVQSLYQVQGAAAQ
jgi:predicted dehydrogenase